MPVVVEATFAQVLSRFLELRPNLPLGLHLHPMAGGVPPMRTPDWDMGAGHCQSAKEVTSEGTRQNTRHPQDKAPPEGASGAKHIAQL